MHFLYPGKQNFMQNKELQTLCYRSLALSFCRIHCRSAQLTRCEYHISTGKQQENTSYNGPNTDFPRGWLFFSYKHPMCLCHWDPKILHFTNIVYMRLIPQYTSNFSQNHWRSFWLTELVSGAQTGQLLLCLLAHREAFLAQWLIWWGRGGAGPRGAVSPASANAEPHQAYLCRLCSPCNGGFDSSCSNWS